MADTGGETLITDKSVPIRRVKTEENYDLDNEAVEIDNQNVEDPDNKLNPSPSFKQRWFGPLTEGGVRASTMSATAATFGTGCLTFPYIISEVGVIPGVLIFLLVSFSMLYTLHLLSQSSLNANIFNFGELTKKSVNNFCFIIYNVSTICFLIGAIMTYELTSYQFLMDIFSSFFYEGDEEKRVPIKWKFAIIITVSCFCLQLPLCLIKNLSQLKYSSLVATVSIILVTIITLITFFCKMSFENVQWVSSEKMKTVSWFLQLTMITNAFVVFMFGYLNHNGFLLVIKNLKNPNEKRINKVLFRSFIIECIFYLILGLSGYFINPELKNEFFINESEVNRIIYIIAKAILIPCLQCLIPIRWNLLKESLASFFPRIEISSKVNLILTIVMLILMNYSLLFIGKVIDIIGFVGGIFGVMICYFLPLFIFVAIFGKTRFRSIVGYVFLVFFGIIGIISTEHSLFKSFYT